MIPKGVPLCYLAGPVRGTTWDEAEGWREEAKDTLWEKGILGIDPLRSQQKHDDELLGDFDPDSNLSSRKSVLATSRFDCARSDVVLVNLLGADDISIGSMMEVAWAYELRKPVVLVIELGNPHHHAMLEEASSYICSTLDDGIDTVIELLSA